MAGAVALAGGVAVLIAANGTFGGVLTASGAPAGAAATDATGGQGGAGEKGRVPAHPGQAPDGAKGASEARELQKGEARPPSGKPSSGPATTSSGRPAAPETTGGPADPGAVKGETVPGSTEAGDAEVSLPEPDGGADYKADRFSKHTDPEAAEYFRTHWGPDDKAMKRLKDIRTVGGYLRIYTDLPDTADNSRTAITLCKRGLQYLRESGVRRPIVFVQAEFGENGNPVLANILGPSDRNCRVTYPEPN
ncbi:MAG: hypothetical protein HOV96_15835 [Nonomuraea sp.]|nr:hypothetical protein [Nonomuraea sp.]NUS09016.1 hypothetical protein [Nonomuraea sp.]